MEGNPNKMVRATTRLKGDLFMMPSFWRTIASMTLNCVQLKKTDATTAMAAKKKEAARIKAEYLVALDEVEAAAAKSPAARKVLNSIIFGLVEAVGGVDIYVKSTSLEDGISSRDLRKLEIFAGLKNLVSDANAYLGNLDYLRRYINRPANAKCE